MTHSPEQIPGWAFGRVQELTGDYWDPRAAREHPVSKAFARYIAAHEEESVDPIEAELHDAMETVFANGFHAWCEAIAEYAPKLREELARRGIELGRDQ